MRAIACLLLVLFVSLAWFGICNGAVWFEGYDPQEPQEIRLLNVEHKIPVSRYTATPVCSLILSEAEPQIVSLTIVVTTWAMGYQNENFETWLSVDSKEPEKLFGTLDVTPSAAGESYQRQYDVTLSGLGDGTHLIEIRIAGEYDSYYGVGNYDCEGSVSVIIDTIPPKVSILSLENETYSAASIPLNFTTSEPISQSTYSLDGQENVTIAGNTTLSELTTGDHNITVYATDEAGNIGASDTIYFSVEVPEPFPTLQVVAVSVAIVAVVGAGLLVYFKKRKRC